MESSLAQRAQALDNERTGHALLSPWPAHANGLGVRTLTLVGLVVRFRNENHHHANALIARPGDARQLAIPVRNLAPCDKGLLGRRHFSPVIEERVLPRL